MRLPKEIQKWKRETGILLPSTVLIQLMSDTETAVKWLKFYTHREKRQSTDTINKQIKYVDNEMFFF